jgi:hypothetical protein
MAALNDVQAFDERRLLIAGSAGCQKTTRQVGI